MRHRLGNKSLSRPTAHRILMLRNLVSSLLQHQQITTTLTKAKETQKLVEKVIGWGKIGGKDNWDRANGFLLNPNETLSPLFTTFATRYASRAGGYTRLHRSGHRQGDNAPLAVLELVDSPHDLKYELTASAVGRELAIKSRQGGGKSIWGDFLKSLGTETEVVNSLGKSDFLESLTRKNCGKALKFRTLETSPISETLESTAEAPEADSLPPPPATPSSLFLARAYTHYLRSLATLSLSTLPVPSTSKPLTQLTQRLNPSDRRGAPREVVTIPLEGRIGKAGDRRDGFVEGEEVSKRGGPISRAKGSMGREARRVEWKGKEARAA